MQTDTVSETSMLYRCPMCKTPVEIDEHYVGETIDCPSCKRPFEVTPPQAWPISPDDVDSQRRSDTPRVSPDDVAGMESVERVIHPVVFRRHLAGTTVSILGVIAGLAGIAFGLSGQLILGVEPTITLVTSGVLLAVCGAFLLKWYVQSRFQSLSLTNERMIYQQGIISRQTSEIRHDDVRNVKVDQNIVERIFAFGDIAISSAGQDDMEIIINDIPRPQEVVNFIRKRQ
ncbi:PH domain-containing protein [Stieleria sp. JC731]|uniref:PH domain-containing protein n=1 Tax=Pirellulaceae TaxID=2691357 RepID=UPI001E60AD42|nr:PH domain-containing protein [Stieleria sp. JC731]MCC9600263.1 PH domain-containing protein [Stieleria sp. JC731]